MKFVLLSVGLISLFSCSSQSDLKIARLDDYYQSSGIEQYILSELPEWANFFESGQCKRSKQMKFFDIDKVIKSLNIPYQEAVQIQYSFNMRLWELNQENKIKDYTLKDYQFLFYDVVKQVSGGKKEYRLPKYDKIVVFWGDYNWSNSDFVSLVQKKSQENILPVFVSGCLSANEIRRILEQNRLQAAAEYIIPQELFAVSAKGYYLKLNELVEAKKIELYIPKGSNQKIFGAVDVIKEY